MGFLDRVLHRDQGQGSPEERARINETLKRMLRIIPRLRHARRYRERLAPAIAISLRYLDDLLASLPVCHEVNANAWSSDPYLRTFFATPNDLITAFSRSEELHAYFERNPGLLEAHATLGMTMTERHVLGVALEGDAIRYDVEQTMLCFGDYSVRFCGRTESDLREEIGRRMIDQLAVEGLGRLAVDRHELLAQGRELLQARLALLERQGTGMGSVVGGGPQVSSEELAQVQKRIEENARHLADLRAPTEVIEHEFERVREVLSTPASHVYITTRRLWLDLMNVVRHDGAQASRELEFHLARIPGQPPQMRAFALVRFPQAELLPAGFHIDAAMGGL